MGYGDIMNKRALITGISGQDGAYLAQFLLSKGYEVFGTSRNPERAIRGNLHFLGIHDKVKMYHVDYTTFSDVALLLKHINPHEIYHLSGQSSISRSMLCPFDTYDSIVYSTLNIMSAMRVLPHEVKMFNTCSGEVFGETGLLKANEYTSHYPLSIYASAKSASFYNVQLYRDYYNMFVCSGILFNHESVLRPLFTFSKKIINTVVEISKGNNVHISVGDPSISRDFGYAPEYVEAMWLMLQYDTPLDFVVATGQSNTLGDFIQYAFECIGKDHNEYVSYNNPEFHRDKDHRCSGADPSKIKRIIGWKAESKMKDVVKKLIDNS